MTLHELDELDAPAVRRWDELLATSTSYPSPFLSYAFCRAVNEVRGGVRVLLFQDKNGTTALLPFQTRNSRTFLSLAEKAGGGMSDYFGLVGKVPGALSPGEILGAARITSLRFDHGVADMCPFPFIEAEKTSGIRVHADDFSRFTANLTKNDKYFVKEVMRCERRLSTEIGPVSFTWDTADSGQELARLVSAKREQYRRTNAPDTLRTAWKEALLYRLLQEREVSNCRVVLSTLHAGEDWISSNLSLACGNVLHFWYPVYEAKFRRFGPGHNLFFKIIEAGISRGFRIFDFGQGELDYKSKYQGEVYELWKGTLRQNSIAGLADRMLQSVEWRLASSKAHLSSLLSPPAAPVAPRLGQTPARIVAERNSSFERIRPRIGARRAKLGAAPQELRTKLFSIEQLPEEVILRWNALMGSSSSPSTPFLSYAFCRAVHSVRGGVQALVIESGDGTAGILPFQLKKGRKWVGHAEKVGGELSDYFGIVGNLKGRLTSDALLEAANLSCLRFDHALSQLCPFSFADAESSTGVRLHFDSYAGFITSVTRSDHGFVREIDRRARRLASEIGAIRFCWNVEDPSAELERLITAKRAQYGRTGVRDVLKRSSQRNLLHRLVQQPHAPECRPVLSTLYAGDTWIASKLSLASPGALHSWFSVFDPQYRRYGPGHLMNFSFIEAGIGEGFNCFDFGEGDAEYKFKYQGEPYLVWKGVIRRNSMGGMSERILQSLEWRIDRAGIAARKIASLGRPLVEPGPAR